MGLIGRNEYLFVRSVGELSYTNPFTASRFELERQALGKDYVEESSVFWSMDPTPDFHRRENLVRLSSRSQKIASQLRERIINGSSWSDEELMLYDDLIVYLIFYELFEMWGKQRIHDASVADANRTAWKRYCEAFAYWLELPGVTLPSLQDKNHLFALYHQVYRAFFSIFECVIGRSEPIAGLRAKIWQSIFTHNVRRYRKNLYKSLGQITTLIQGPSGSGKELVSQAIGMSRYVPFDPKKQCFVIDPSEHYHAINLSAFSKSLIESELFGHTKGAFTDAREARAGWLEASGDLGAVLLDEIGELDLVTQVKLLRLLQSRQFQRVGETKIREFQGKIIAATNRDLRAEINKGTFREDLYYRLCSDVIVTPSLAEQLGHSPNALDDLVAYACQRLSPDDYNSLVEEVLHWIRNHLPQNYLWPGNIRELEQCVRNVLIHGSYSPDQSSALISTHNSQLVRQIDNLELTADELLANYCKIAYSKTKNFEKAARLLQMDRRTVRAKIDSLAQLKPNGTTSKSSDRADSV
ncbi:MAG: sigma-54 factor interaction domain-containing protein [Pirellula sp.]|jgi:DNA-binding NtrC family response regulator|nr:sigma-54 factor interaction domain-containing protein [Pirellula sp.]